MTGGMLSIKAQRAPLWRYLSQCDRVPIRREVREAIKSTSNGGVCTLIGRPDPADMADLLHYWVVHLNAIMNDEKDIDLAIVNKPYHGLIVNTGMRTARDVAAASYGTLTGKDPSEYPQTPTD